MSSRTRDSLAARGALSPTTTRAAPTSPSWAPLYLSIAAVAMGTSTAYTTDLEWQLNPSRDPMIFKWSSELPYLPKCEQAGDTYTAPTTPPSSIFPAGECPAPGYDHTAWPSVPAVRAHIPGSVRPGDNLAVTLTDAAPGHVLVTVKHVPNTVASTALLYCASTVHLNVAVPAAEVSSGDSLFVTVTVTENRSFGITEEYVEAS